MTSNKQIIPYSLRELLEAGVHFGHQKQRWNPKMKSYIYGAKNGIHIIDLTKTYILLNQALQALADCVTQGGRILFVGTKKQASASIAEAAEKCAQYYVNNRWLGGMMTNWETVSASIHRLSSLDETIMNPIGYTKKEVLSLSRQRDRINRDLGGIRSMGGLPTMLFVIDTNREHLAIKEAQKLGIPVVAIVDTNTDPELIDYPIPGNDDAVRSIELYCNLVSQAVLEGLRNQQINSEADLGASADLEMDVNIDFENKEAVAPVDTKKEAGETKDASAEEKS